MGGLRRRRLELRWVAMVVEWVVDGDEVDGEAL